MKNLGHSLHFITRLWLFIAAVGSISYGSQYDYPSSLAKWSEPTSEYPVIKKATLAQIMQDVLEGLKKERKKIGDHSGTGHAQNDANQINTSLDEIRTLAANIDKKTETLTNVEERLKSEMKRLRDGMNSTIGKIMPEIQNVRTELTNVEERQKSEMKQLRDGMNSTIGKIMPEIQNARTELANIEERQKSEMTQMRDSTIAKIMPEIRNVRTELTNVEKRQKSEMKQLRDGMNSTIGKIIPEIQNVRTEQTNVEKRQKSEMKSLRDGMNSTIGKIIPQIQNVRMEHTNVEKRQKSEMKQLRDGMNSTIGKIMPEIRNVRTELTNVEERQKSEMKQLRDGMNYTIGKIIPEIQNVRTEQTNVEKRQKSEMKSLRDGMNSTIGKIIPEIQNVRTEQTNVEKRQKSEMKQLRDGMNSTIGKIMPEIRNVRTELTNVEERQKSEMKQLRDGMNYTIGQIMPEIQRVRIELKNVEEHLSERMDSAIEKNKPEFESVRTELGNVGQNLEEALLVGMEVAGNRTIDALRRHLQPFEHPKNCEDIQLLGLKSSGVYRIYPFDPKENSNGKDVYCDLLTAGGGWTVIQRRKESPTVQEDFERTWNEYAAGFGNLHESHWIGLDVIAALTNAVDSKLRIELTDWEDQNRTATYSNFRISSNLYRLNVSGYYGDAGDSLKQHNGMAFSTKDRDNDDSTTNSCAQLYNGAWWFKSCYHSSLNGIYFKETDAQGTSAAEGINWRTWHTEKYSLKRTEMKLRSSHFQP